MNPLSTYIFVIAVSVCLTIYGKYRSVKLYYFFKPASGILIFTMPLILSHADDNFAYFMLGGLLTAILGDSLLMFPKRFFRQGLLAFLITHIFYIAAFTSSIDEFNWLVLIPFVLYGGIIYSRLNITERKLKIPVGIYTTIICIMGFTAFNVWLTYDNNRSLILFIAALLFILSDSVLAYNKFSRKFKTAELIILSSYFTAQTIFAWILV